MPQDSVVPCQHHLDSVVGKSAMKAEEVVWLQNPPCLQMQCRWAALHVLLCHGYDAWEACHFTIKEEQTIGGNIGRVCSQVGI